MANLRSTQYCWNILVALARKEQRTQIAVLENAILAAAKTAKLDISKISRY